MMIVEIDITEESVEYQQLCDLLNMFGVEWWVNDSYEDLQKKSCNKTKKDGERESI